MAAVKEYKVFNFDFKEIDDKGYFEGYASTFGNVDQGGDVVVKGAFANTLKGKAAEDIPILYQHDTHRPIGNTIKIKEDEHGLFIGGQLTLGTKDADESLKFMKAKVLKKLSIGYSVVERDYSKDGDIRYLKEVDLWEYSLVTFPMNVMAGITMIKSADEIIPLLIKANTVRDIEGVLRDANIPRDVASYLATRHRLDSQREVVEIVKALNDINNAIRNGG